MENIDGLSANLGDIGKAFVMGVRFDLVISGYLLLLPFLILTIFYIRQTLSLCLSNCFHPGIYLFTLAFAICAAHPYFNQFFPG
ncbi:MAG: hypothetical protein IPH20_20925 [Bacteroidales bacterium]|nr:hypothetical protein [Bacteroidales bacterium]